MHIVDAAPEENVEISLSERVWRSLRNRPWLTLKEPIFWGSGIDEQTRVSQVRILETARLNGSISEDELVDRVEQALGVPDQEVSFQIEVNQIADFHRWAALLRKTLSVTLGLPLEATDGLLAISLHPTFEKPLYSLRFQYQSLFQRELYLRCLIATLGRFPL